MSRPGSPEEFASVARSIQAEWSAAFAARDISRLVALYAPEVSFWGSTATLHTDAEGVGEYFSTLPYGYRLAHHAAPHILGLGQDSFAASGEVVFDREIDGQVTPLPFRMTQVFIRTGSGWKIALHHASSRPA